MHEAELEHFDSWFEAMQYVYRVAYGIEWQPEVP
jgi:hypothetical protein